MGEIMALAQYSTANRLVDATQVKRRRRFEGVRLDRAASEAAPPLRMGVVSWWCIYMRITYMHAHGQIIDRSGTETSQANICLAVAGCIIKCRAKM
jgi:hypothetical protein